MIRLIFIVLIALSGLNTQGQQKTIHVFVSLCDNEFQGIVPVPSHLGDGKNPGNNLYWGAAYGVKSYLRYKSDEWQFIQNLETNNSIILERVLFKHIHEDAYLIADAYDGEFIKECTEDFLKACNRQNTLNINHDSLLLQFGGKSDLIAYCGHDGLMDFDVKIDYKNITHDKAEVVILACYSKAFFKNEIKAAGAIPVLWTTHLMAPEAYTLEAVIAAWLDDEPEQQIHEQAAQAYHKYQKCGMKGARNLFTSGF